MTLLLVYVAAAVGFSFLCSLLEASFLSARLINLIERQERGERGASILLTLKQERVDDALSSILILNTVANTAGATLAGAQAEAVFGAREVFGFPWVGVFTAGLILLILVGSEIIPKTLGAVYADRLVPFTAYLLRGLTGFFWILLHITRLITSWISSDQRRPISRRELSTMVATAAREGTLEVGDSQVVKNILRYHEIRVEDVMTPRTVVVMLPAATAVAELLEHHDAAVFSRLPIFEDAPDDADGYVLQREVLLDVARGAIATSEPLERFKRKAIYVPGSQSVAGALRLLNTTREHLALVTDEYGGIQGLVTLEDLLETVLGIEILDESDRVADLRAEAKKLRERRLQERQEHPPTPIPAPPRAVEPPRPPSE